MSTQRLTLAEFARPQGMGQMAAANALQADSAKPKHERAYPFATSYQNPSGKWSYVISRARFEAWQAGKQPRESDTPVLLQLSRVLLQYGQSMIALAGALNKEEAPHVCTDQSST